MAKNISNRKNWLRQAPYQSTGVLFVNSNLCTVTSLSLKNRPIFTPPNIDRNTGDIRKKYVSHRLVFLSQQCWFIKIIYTPPIHLLKFCRTGVFAHRWIIAFIIRLLSIQPCYDVVSHDLSPLIRADYCGQQLRYHQNSYHLCIFCPLSTPIMLSCNTRQTNTTFVCRYLPNNLPGSCINR